MPGGDQPQSQYVPHDEHALCPTPTAVTSGACGSASSKFWDPCLACTGQLHKFGLTLPGSPRDEGDARGRVLLLVMGCKSVLAVPCSPLSSILANVRCKARLADPRQWHAEQVLSLQAAKAWRKTTSCSSWQERNALQCGFGIFGTKPILRGPVTAASLKKGIHWVQCWGGLCCEQGGALVPCRCQNCTHRKVCKRVPLSIFERAKASRRKLDVTAVGQRLDP